MSSSSADVRGTTARGASEALLSARGRIGSMKVVAGFDGMVDSICRVVDHKEGATSYTPMHTIAQMAERVARAAGKSINIELRAERVKIGGNGVLMADGLAAAGARVSFIGSIADDASPSKVHALFGAFAGRCASVHPTCPPGLTDACEFDDGKVMLGKTDNLAKITWDSTVRAVGGLDALVRMADGAGLLVPVAWTQVPAMDEIWDGLTRQVFPKIERDRRPPVFIDLADPAKRTENELKGALERLKAMNAMTPVTLGLNLAESQRIARAIGAPEPRTMEEAADRIRAGLGLGCVVVHGRESASAATERDRATFEGPFVRKPFMSTGAGDHFNAGFALSGAAGVSLAQQLAAGSALSGWYVRKGAAPSLDEWAGFLRDLPAPER